MKGNGHKTREKDHVGIQDLGLAEFRFSFVAMIFQEQVHRQPSFVIKDLAFS
jgi:hypothetical protein